MLLSPRLQKLHVDSIVVRYWMVLLKTRPSWRGTTQNLQMYPVSLRFWRAEHTLHCLAGYFLFPLPTTNNFFQFVYSEITGESAWWVLFRPPWLLFTSLATEGHQNWTHFDSGLPISRTFLPRAGSSCTLHFCWYLVSCTQKNALRRAQFSRYSTTFFGNFTVFLRTE